jgi:hypothetical protein
MPNERRRIRNRLYEKKRRLLRQVLAGKITQARMDAALTEYALHLSLMVMLDCTTNKIAAQPHGETECREQT